jgi:hypothetical protein
MIRARVEGNAAYVTVTDLAGHVVEVGPIVAVP